SRHPCAGIRFVARFGGSGARNGFCEFTHQSVLNRIIVRNSALIHRPAQQTARRESPVTVSRIASHATLLLPRDVSGTTKRGDFMRARGQGGRALLLLGSIMSVALPFSATS